MLFQVMKHNGLLIAKNSVPAQFFYRITDGRGTALSIQDGELVEKKGKGAVAKAGVSP